MSTPQRILIIGATSAIAQAYARRRAPTRASFLLAGRNLARLAAVADDLRVCGARAAEPLVADLTSPGDAEATVSALRNSFGEPDEVLIAYGELGDQAASDRDFATARRLLDINFVSVAGWILALLQDRPSSQPLGLAVIGSVAGDRGRASNFIYGSAKAALDRLLEGLAQKYADTPVHVLTVKPGFVDTPMTEAIPKGPLWASPDRIAADIIRALDRHRRVVYTPWFWWGVMAVIRHLPWFVFKRLKI